MVVLDVQIVKLPGLSCAAPYLLVTSHTAEYPMRRGSMWSIRVSRARSDQDSIRAAGVTSSLIRNAGAKEKKEKIFRKIYASKVQLCAGERLIFLRYEHSMSGKAQLNLRSDGVVILDSACHTQEDGVQGYLIISGWVSEATGAESGNGTCML
eukprot:388663-Pelagomonas_calceolata.AAC.1